MKKLTNAQMEILAQAAVDRLEQSAKAKAELIKDSEEYKMFESTYSDEVLADLGNRYNKALEYAKEVKLLEDKLDILKKFVEDKYPKMSFPRWKSTDSAIAELMEKYKADKKRELFPDLEFDRHKMLTKIKAEILLSTVADPNELIQEVTKKFES